MQFTSIIILALAAITSATPVSIPENTTLESRGEPPRVQFFFDEACTYMSLDSALKFSNKKQSQSIASPANTKSAWWVNTGGLFSWTVSSGGGDHTIRPAVGQCVSYLNGVYVTGDVGAKNVH